MMDSSDKFKSFNRKLEMWIRNLMKNKLQTLANVFKHYKAEERCVKIVFQPLKIIMPS